MDSFLVKFGDCTQVYEESSQTSVMEIYSYHVPSLMFSRVINKPQLPQQLNNLTERLSLKGSLLLMNITDGGIPLYVFLKTTHVIIFPFFFFQVFIQMRIIVFIIDVLICTI